MPPNRISLFVALLPIALVAGCAGQGATAAPPAAAPSPAASGKSVV